MESDLHGVDTQSDHDGDGLLTIDEVVLMGQIHMFGTPITTV